MKKEDEDNGFGGPCESQGGGGWGVSGGQGRWRGPQGGGYAGSGEGGPSGLGPPQNWYQQDYGGGPMKSTRLIEQLPNSILEKSIGFLPPTDQDSFDLKAFIKQRLPVVDHSQINDQLIKNFNLTVRRKRPEKHIFKKKIQLSAKEKRKLGLFKVPKVGLKYNDFLSLHNLWVQYMTQTLDFSSFENQTSGQVDISNKHWEPLSTQLTKSDYHGAYVRVARSRCFAHVGVEGIVVMDTKNTFKILGKDDFLRTIPKETSIFTLKLGKYKMTVYGKHFCLRPSERSTRKVKASLLPDL